MDIVAVFAQSLGTSLVICGVVLVFTMVGTLFWVRSTVRDKSYCFVLSESKQLTGKLLKPNGVKVKMGSGADETEYLISPKKQFWSSWPPGFPRWLQEPVPTFFYVEGNAEPVDPYDSDSIISPKSLRKISDEAMLRTMWKDVRETLGIKAKFWGGNTLLLLLVLGAVIASAAAAFMAYTTSGQLADILRMLGG